MKNVRIFALGLVFCLFGSTHAKSTGLLSVSFEENRGQGPSDVRFLARGQGYGVTFTPITTTGFGDKYNFGVRTMAATPYGLFLGTANYYYGLKIFLGVPQGFRGFNVFVPLVRS